MVTHIYLVFFREQCTIRIIILFFLRIWYKKKKLFYQNHLNIILHFIIGIDTYIHIIYYIRIYNRIQKILCLIGIFLVTNSSYILSLCEKG